MKRRIVLVALLVLLGSVVQGQHVKAASCVLLSGTYNADGSGFQTVGYFNVVAGHDYLGDFNQLAGNTDYGTNFGADGTGHQFASFFTKATQNALPLQISGDKGNVISYTVSDLSCAGPSAPGVTFFNPGDGRVDGKPGDRIAVWCNVNDDPPSIVLYGVGDQQTGGSTGVLLAIFKLTPEKVEAGNEQVRLLKLTPDKAEANSDSLRSAQGNGSAGIFISRYKGTPEKVEAGSESIRASSSGQDYGTVSIQTDGQGNFYIAWNGGIFHATGQGDFAKTVYCPTFVSPR